MAAFAAIAGLEATPLARGRVFIAPAGARERSRGWEPPEKTPTKIPEQGACADTHSPSGDARKRQCPMRAVSEPGCGGSRFIVWKFVMIRDPGGPLRCTPRLRSFAPPGQRIYRPGRDAGT